jgi:hypothetical protein
MKIKLIMFLLFIVTILCCSNYTMATDNDIGTYALFKIREGNNEVLYKINTKTGKVWCYSDNVILKSEDFGLTGKEAERLNKLISQATKEKKHVYTLPYWWPTSEEPGARYIMK